MAAPSTSSIAASNTISTKSYDTALCVIPPGELCGNVDQLRQLYDKAYGKWPPHVNLIYPFVVPENLPRVQEQIKAYFDEHLDKSEAKMVSLNSAGMFAQRSNSTVFLGENTDSSDSAMTKLRSMAFAALGWEPTASHLHLTIGQSENNTLSSQEYLMSKARLVPALTFHVAALAILVRERATSSKEMETMRLWGIIEIATRGQPRGPQMSEFWIAQNIDNGIQGLRNPADTLTSREDKAAFVREIQTGTTFNYDSHQKIWSPYLATGSVNEVATGLTIASYNVLVDSEYPPARERDPLLVQTILAESARADILVLQEVSDEFLSHMLSYSEIRQLYPFTSHGPPSQRNIGPLPSLRNIVILSRYAFTWNFVPFQRRHKGALVAKFEEIISDSSSGRKQFAVAGVHLTCGLTDGSVDAKRTQLDNLLNHLEQKYTDDPWIIAGDFNIVTSTYTIDTALKDKSISKQTARTLAGLEFTISNTGLLDAWAVARVEGTDETPTTPAEDLFEGEEGGTFNPRDNILAAITSGTSNNRPQRYDRVLVRPKDALRVARFNHFGLPEQVDGVEVVPSDHSGIKATLQVLQQSTDGNLIETSQQHTLEHKRANEPLSNSSNLTSALDAHAMFPTMEDVKQRQDAFALLKRIILGVASVDDSAPTELPMVMVPVGSYALNTWTSDSDIDCLCIGTISSNTFFKLARQRLVRADNDTIRIIRKVEANTGTMLELSVNSVSMDLQYCPAARVVERWSEFRHLPASDPIFNLSILSLRKLKPYRDLLQIQRTLPSAPTFRLAYRCIKLWATQRGVYAAKLGYIGGIHITLMLTYICKRLAHDSGSLSAGDLVATFFHHYANLDWANDMVYDTFFHKQKPRYHRTARESMVVLGYHAPNSNIAHTSTTPSLQALIQELKAADERLSDASMTWGKFFGADSSAPLCTVSNGVQDFLSKYERYVKVDIQFWGRTLAKGQGLVGWVESRCLSLVVEIHKALPTCNLRLWPARFTENNQGETTDYQGCYLIGLSSHIDTGLVSGEISIQSLDKVFDRFLNQLKAEEKFYDAETSWIGISLATSTDLISHCPDTRKWGIYTPNLEPDSDDEDELFDDLEEVSDKRPARILSQRPKSTSTPVSSTKLRPASDVLNRLRWDPNLDPAEYIIGYEDRFLGAKETSLERWKTEQTDEEFIPQHRILYFKKRTSGGVAEIVWERVSRIDKVFRSGIGAGEGRSVE